MLRILVFVCFVSVLRAQGASEVTLPVCNSRSLNATQKSRFGRVLADVNSAFDCVQGQPECCTLRFNDFFLTCNATANLCLFRTPVSSRTGSASPDESIYFVLRCSTEDSGACALRADNCDLLTVAVDIIAGLENERLICGWERGITVSSYGCAVLKVEGFRAFYRTNLCEPFIGEGVHDLQLGNILSLGSDDPSSDFLPEALPLPSPDVSAEPLTTPDSEPSNASPPSSSSETRVASPTPSATNVSTGEPVCFPAFASVRMGDGSTLLMEKLRVGARVATARGAESEVFAFTHRDESVNAAFLEIRTNSSRTLTLTPGHYLYVAPMRLIPASHVRLGDELVLADGRGDKVKDVRRVVHTGIYSPQTFHGDIVVNGFIVSTFTTAVKPLVAHAALSPLRAIFSSLGLRFTMFEDHHKVGFVRLARKLLSLSPDYFSN